MLARQTVAAVCAVIAVAAAVHTANAHNGDFAITSADICAPVNVGKANRNIQNIRGTVKNLSEDESIAVSCPLVTISENGFFQLSVVVENESSEPQNFRCVLREKDIFNLDVQTLTRSVDVQGNAIAFLEWEEVIVADAAIDRMNLTCLLPPLSNLGLIASFSL
jgi:hypothetical protein